MKYSLSNQGKRTVCVFENRQLRKKQLNLRGRKYNRLQKFEEVRDWLFSTY